MNKINNEKWRKGYSVEFDSNKEYFLLFPSKKALRKYFRMKFLHIPNIFLKVYECKYKDSIKKFTINNEIDCNITEFYISYNAKTYSNIVLVKQFKDFKIKTRSLSFTLVFAIKMLFEN